MQVWNMVEYRSHNVCIPNSNGQWKTDGVGVALEEWGDEKKRCPEEWRYSFKDFSDPIWVFLTGSNGEVKNRVIYKILQV